MGLPMLVRLYLGIESIGIFYCHNVSESGTWTHVIIITVTLNEHHGISNHQYFDCLFNSLGLELGLGKNIKENIKAHVTGPLWGDSLVISLHKGPVTWQHSSGSTLAQVIACCRQATNYYLNQCWLLINGPLWHFPASNFIVAFPFE